jgi:hypothetical protein
MSLFLARYESAPNILHPLHIDTGQFNHMLGSTHSRREKTFNESSVEVRSLFVINQRLRGKENKKELWDLNLEVSDEGEKNAKVND